MKYHVPVDKNHRKEPLARMLSHKIGQIKVDAMGTPEQDCKWKDLTMARRDQIKVLLLTSPRPLL